MSAVLDCIWFMVRCWVVFGSWGYLMVSAGGAINEGWREIVILELELTDLKAGRPMRFEGREVRFTDPNDESEARASRIRAVNTSIFSNRCQMGLMRLAAIATCFAYVGAVYLIGRPHGDQERAQEKRQEFVAITVVPFAFSMTIGALIIVMI